MNMCTWLDSTALSSKNLNQKFLNALQDQGAQVNTTDIKTPIALTDLLGFNTSEGAFDTTTLVNNKRETPLTQQEFYNAIEQGITDVQTIKQQLMDLRAQAKKERGYLSKAFSIFSKEKPIEQVMDNVVSFEKYCRKHHITFDSVEKKLKIGTPPKTLCQRMVDFRFLMAAGAGLALGLGGVSMADVPLLGAAPGLFFGNMHYVAMPFICLNIFKAFSEKNIFKEAKTMLGFGVTMAAGFMVSLGVTSAMADVLPDLSNVLEADASGATPERGFNLYDYLIQGIAGSAAFASIYGGCKKVMGIQTDPQHVEWQHLEKKPGMISQLFNSKTVQSVVKPVQEFNTNVVSPVVHDFLKTIAPVINPIGKGLTKAAGWADKTFGAYMNWLGIPATFSLVSQSFSAGGISQMGAFAGYFGTVGIAMLTTAALIGGISYARYKLRGKDFKSMLSTAATAFSLSSSAATMPYTKKTLKEIGVSDKTIDSVVPLGANFNMMGTSLYLGTTAACAAIMFGIPMTPELALTVASIVITTAFGVAGAPASNLSLLDPVLSKLNLPEEAVQKVFAMVLPADRPLDMAQTALNVTGDQLVAMEVDDLRDKRLQQGKTDITELAQGSESAPLNPQKSQANTNSKPKMNS